jgi:hypothetical protein
MTSPMPTWVNDGKHDEEIARFVLEGDDYVNAIVAAARDALCQLTANQHRSFASAVGAATPDSLRAAVEALYRHLKHDYHLVYEYERAFDEITKQQQLRLPAVTCRENAGTCLDLTVLFLSCLASAKLWPILVHVQGPDWAHALAACWLREPDKNRDVLLPLDELRQRVAAGEIVAVECIGFTEGFPGRPHKLSFAEASFEGEQLLQRLDSRHFRFAVDIRRAWQHGVPRGESGATAGSKDDERPPPRTAAWRGLAVLVAAAVLVASAVAVPSFWIMYRAASGSVPTPLSAPASSPDLKDLTIAVGTWENKRRVSEPRLRPLVAGGADQVLEALPPLSDRDAFRLYGTFDRPVYWYLVWFDTEGQFEINDASAERQVDLTYPSDDKWQPVNPKDRKGIHLLMLVAGDRPPAEGKSELQQSLGNLGRPPQTLPRLWAVRGGGERIIDGGEEITLDYLAGVRRKLPPEFHAVYSLWLQTQ